MIADYYVDRLRIDVLTAGDVEPPRIDHCDCAT